MIVTDKKFDELDPVWLLNQYRAAEISGAGAIMRMGRLAKGAQLSTDLTRHLRDEAVHAWLWTRALREIDGEIVDVDQPYQSRLALHFGLPRSLTELLALTWVSESRGVEQYRTHLAIAEISTTIRQTLRAILKDETWHVAYIGEELTRRVRSDASIQQTIDRALEADAKAISELGASVAPLNGPRPRASTTS
jgi:hypothetical protein